MHFCIFIVQSDALVYGDEYELRPISVFFCMNFVSVFCVSMIFLMLHVFVFPHVLNVFVWLPVFDRSLWKPLPSL